MPGKAPEDQRRAAILRAAFVVAARERLTGLTVQQVAAEAGVSKGLVFFYFRCKSTLLVELLEWMLARTIAAQVGGDLDPLASPEERLLAALRRDIERLPDQRASVELFFDYWVMGTRHPVVREKIRGALDAYRDAYRPLVEAVIRSAPDRYRHVTPEGLCGVVASCVEGCALQAVMDPDRFDVHAYLATIRSLVHAPDSRPALNDSHPPP